MDDKQLEKRLQETADIIEAKVDGLKKDTATKTEVLDLIEERTGEDSEFVKNSKANLDKLNTGLTEITAETEKLQKDIRELRKARMDQPLAAKGSAYKGYFSSPQEAKAFALLVMAASTAGSSKVTAQHEKAVKGLESMGIEPYWLDANGRKTMTGSSQAGGGALVTIEQIPSIKMLLETYGKYRANAQIMPMGAGETLQPKVDGLLTMYCPGEGGTITAADPTIKLIALTPKTICGLTAYSMELDDDSLVALGEMLIGLFARSFAYYEDLCGFLGDGTSTYFGFKGITGALRAVDATIGNIKSLVVGAGNAYSELTLANFESVVGTAPEFADDGELKWFVHRYFFWTVMVKLALAAGGATATEITAGAATKDRTYLGYPAEFTQVMPKAEANSQICALLANLRQGAMLGVRGGLEFAQSTERYFEKGVVAVRGIDRIAINAHGVGDTTNAGPICGLITAAS